jgi:hypothetical protein
MDAYNLGRSAGIRVKQADATEGWGASLGRAAGSATGSLGGSFGSSIGGRIGGAIGGLGDKAVSGVKSMFGFGGPKPSAGGPTQGPADPFSQAFGGLLSKSTGGKFGPGQGTAAGNPFTMNNPVFQPHTGFGGLAGGPQAPSVNITGPGVFAGNQAAESNSFLKGFGRGVVNPHSVPENAGTLELSGQLLGSEFDPLRPFRPEQWQANGLLPHQWNPITDMAMTGGGPWGFGVGAVAGRVAPGLSQAASSVLPGGPGAYTNAYRAFVPAGARASLSNAGGWLGHQAMTRGTQAMNLGRSAFGLTPWSMPVARTAATAATAPAAASAFGLGAAPTAGLALYGGYAAGQIPVDLYNVATGKVNLNERAANQLNTQPGLGGYLQNVGENLVHPGEAIADMGILPYTLGRQGYNYLAERSRGADLDKQLAAVKARQAAKTSPNPPSPAI